MCVTVGTSLSRKDVSRFYQALQLHCVASWSNLYSMYCSLTACTVMETYSGVQLKQMSLHRVLWIKLFEFGTHAAVRIQQSLSRLTMQILMSFPGIGNATCSFSGFRILFSCTVQLHSSFAFVRADFKLGFGNCGCT